MSKSWSRWISTQFDLRLPDEVVDWLDAEVWRADRSFTLYNGPVIPEELLDAGSSTVWGGQMLPDTLPWVGDGCGNMLCLRFSPSGTVSEVLRWDHDDVAWAPWGRTLSEALLYDALKTMKTEPDDEWDSPEAMLLADWAARWLGKGFEVPRNPQAAPEYEAKLLAAGVSQVALRRDRCELFLASNDWAQAAQEAGHVRALRSDLAWPFAVQGRAAEHGGKPGDAIEHYRAGLEAQGTSEDFTRLWRDSAKLTKVVAQRLLEFRKQVPDTGAPQEPLLRAWEEQTARNYWVTRGNEALRDAPEQAYRCFYNAGWDDFFTDEMPSLLETLAHAAEKMGSPTLAKLAAFHRTAV